VISGDMFAEDWETSVDIQGSFFNALSFEG